MISLVSNFFFLFFSPFTFHLFIYFDLFTLVVYTRGLRARNEYRGTWKTRCIDTPLFGLMRDKLGRTHARSRRRPCGAHCNFSNCTLLSSVCNTFRDSWRSLCRGYLISIDWVLSPLEILKTFSFTARPPAKTPRLLGVADSLESRTQSTPIYFKVLTFRYLLFPLFPLFSWTATVPIAVFLWFFNGGVQMTALFYSYKRIWNQHWDNLKVICC